MLEQTCYPSYKGYCTGALNWAVTRNSAPPSPPPPFPPPVPLPAGTSTCAPFSLVAGQNYVDCLVTLPAQTTLKFGTCGVAGSTCMGNTNLRLLSKRGTILTLNDNGPAEIGCGLCSYTTYTNTARGSVPVYVRQACQPTLNTTCGGTTAYNFTSIATGRKLLQASYGRRFLGWI